MMITPRLPRRLHAAAKEKAAELGMSLNDFVGELLSRETGVPFYENQEPLIKSA